MPEQNDRAALLLEGLRNRIKDAPSTALSSDKAVVDRARTLQLIDNISEVIERELAEYREITDKRARIINEAREQAEDILYEAESSASRIRVSKRREGEPPSFRMSELSGKEKKSLRTANDIYASAVIYTDEMLTEVDELLQDAYKKIDREYDRMRRTLKSRIDEISDNRHELSDNLASLKTDDRYSQILELSQLLSNELFEAREKERARLKEEKEQMQLEFENEDQEGPSDLPPRKKREEIDPDRTAVPVDEKKEKQNIPVMNRDGESPSLADPDRSPVPVKHRAADNEEVQENASE